MAFSLKVVRPRNINANPKTNSPNDLRLLFWEKIRGKDSAKSG